jgi:predicted alpha/beta hydrolase
MLAKPEKIRLQAEDYQLGARVFSPEGEAAAGILINCGTGLTQRFYKHLARYLAGQGFEVLTYDYRGMGESAPDTLVGFSADKTTWAREDFRAAIGWHRARAPSRPLFVIGHSFGGQAIGFLEESRELDGIILIAAQSGDLRHWTGDDRKKLDHSFNVIVPEMTETHGFLPGEYGTGDDLPAEVAREWRRWCTTAGFFTGLYPETLDNFAEIRGPVLSITFSDDTFYAPRPAVEEMLGWLENADIDDRVIDPASIGEEEIGHFGFFTRVVGDSLWPEVSAWIRARLA